MKLQYSARTDVGRVRVINEDSIFAGELRRQTDDDGTPPRHLLVVADGVGGLERGQWASKKAVSVLAAELPTQLTSREPGDALRLAVQAANHLVWRRDAGEA